MRMSNEYHAERRAVERQSRVIPAMLTYAIHPMQHEHECRRCGEVVRCDRPECGDPALRVGECASSCVPLRRQPGMPERG